MAVTKKKDGSPNVKFFDTAENAAKFEAIKTWVQKNCKKYIQTDPPTAKGLSSLVVQLIQFQEDAFGKHVENPALTKLPMKCFLEFEPNGSLCRILEAVYKFKSEQGWRRFDFQSPSRMDRNVEMFMAVRKALIDGGIVKMPHVYIRPDLYSKLITKMKDIVKKHQGILVESEGEATHIVYAPPTTPDDGNWVRPARKCDSGTLIHWYYLPESYDSWLAHHEVDHDVEEETLPPYKVNANWLLFMSEYNEWLNEEDFEVFDDNAEGRRRKASRVKVKPAELLIASDVEKRRTTRRLS